MAEILKSFNGSKIFFIGLTGILGWLGGPLFADAQVNLINAVRAGDISQIQSALDRGANIDALDSNRQSPLVLAIRQDQLTAARFLLKKGARIKNGSISVLAEAWKRQDTSLILDLLDAGDDPNITEYQHKKTLLMWALENGKTEIVEKSLKMGADIHAKDREGRTVLHYAVFSGQILWILDLLERGSDINAVDDFGNTSLHYSVDFKKRELIRSLISKGVDMGKENKMGETFLTKIRGGSLKDLESNLLKEGILRRVLIKSLKTIVRDGATPDHDTLFFLNKGAGVVVLKKLGNPFSDGFVLKIQTDDNRVGWIHSVDVGE